jgi:hypothetical protein
VAQKGSPIRNVVGAACLIAALVVVAAGFAMMVRALEAGAYGTSRVTWALVALGSGGGLMGTGFALLIWEYGVRHGIRH